jgi:hypothetical protein
VSFRAHLDLLELFLARRGDIVETIQAGLKPQARSVEDGFFAVAREQSRLRGQLEAAHRASGFKPRNLPGLYNGLADPEEMTARACHLWQQTRWPGRNGRVHYAHTLFNLYIIRCLEFLSLRLWDEAPGPGNAGDRLAQLQGVLDELWRTTPGDQPVFVRDARWLIQLAQSPATDNLGAYFDVAQKIAGSFSVDDRRRIHSAGVRMAAGHLRSQTRHYATTRELAFDDERLLLQTRTTNALDFALLIQELAPLLEAYEEAVQAGDSLTRLELADAICQGVSPDPELFLNRVDLLGAYSMHEELFIAEDGDGHAAYTPMGQRHVGLFDEYRTRITRAMPSLRDDCPNFRPRPGAYSPYGALYGFSSHLLEHMALKAVEPEAATRFSLEDVFAAGDAAKLAWVNGWRRLPHISADVAKPFDYPQQFAEDMFNRVERALRADAARPTGRITVADAGDVHARSYDERQLLGDRREGKCLVSYKTSDGWMAIGKAVLTEVLASGRDAKIAAVPPDAVEVLTLMGRKLMS